MKLVTEVNEEFVEVVIESAIGLFVTKSKNTPASIAALNMVKNGTASNSKNTNLVHMATFALAVCEYGKFDINDCVDPEDFDERVTAMLKNIGSGSKDYISILFIEMFNSMLMDSEGLELSQSVKEELAAHVIIEMIRKI